MGELLDILDENYQVIGQETRENVHEKELLHAAFQCWFIKIFDGKPYILFQKRNSRVNYPNLLDTTAAGHLSAGEGPEQGAREIEEELGITIPFEDLSSLGKIRDTLPWRTDKIDNELCHLYAYQYDSPLQSLTLQASEVEGIVCISMEDFSKVIESEGKLDFEVIVYDGQAVESKILNLSMFDFVPHQLAYYQYNLEKLMAIVEV
ncbi:NUDIX hydrolase [Robertmurraya kyonggiensis]|uniref:NUDIX hydrolase n=1 Tax=Robertmurraya kyonggiensis TaxID=1037680 RepID=UPI00130E9F9D|nr:NUDIX domain-containing protein [Robertmurraya kyonggiensis]